MPGFSKKGMRILLMLVMFILVANIGYSISITDVLANGLIRINDFFEGRQYEPYSTAIDFFLFSILFVSFYMVGAKNAFKEFKRPERVIVILLGLITAFLLVLAGFSITLLLPYMHWILFLLLFLLLLWLLKGVQQKPWRILLALAIALLPLALLQGYCEVNWLLYVIIFIIKLYILKGIKNRFLRVFVALIITAIIFFLLQFLCGYFGLPDISGIGEGISSTSAGAATGFGSYAGGLWQNMQSIGFNYRPGIPGWLRSTPTGPSVSDNRLQVVHPQPQQVASATARAPTTSRASTGGGTSAAGTGSASAAASATPPVYPTRIHVDLAYRLGWFEPDFEFRGDKWFEGNREINKNIYEHIHENYGENMGNGNLITYSDGTARNIGVFDFRQTLVAKAYASDAFIVALEGDKASRDDAVQLLEQAESLQPKGAEAYYEIGRAYESIGKADRAQPFYQQAANAESDADKKNSYLSDVERVRGIQNDRKVYDWIDKAYKYYYDVPNNRREPPATRPRSAAPAQQEGELASAQTSSSQNAPQGKLQFMQASIIPGLSNVPWWAWLLFLGLPAILTLLRFLMRKAKRYKKVQDTKRRFSEEEQIRLQIDEIITRSNWAIAKLRRAIAVRNNLLRNVDRTTIYIKALTKEGRDPAILFTKEGREKLLEEHQEIMDILDIEFKFYDRMKELSSIELELLEKVRGKK